MCRASLQRLIVGVALVGCVVTLAGCPLAARILPVLFDTNKLDLPELKAGIIDRPSPVTVTLTGKVVSVADGTGAAATAGVKVGDPVSYTISLDFNGTGYVVDNNGATLLMDTALGYFLANAQAGWLLPDPVPGFFTAPQDLAEIHFAQNLPGAAGTFDDPKGLAVLGSNSHSLVFSTAGMLVSQWDWYTMVGASEQVHDASGNTTTILSWLELSVNGEVPPPRPVPDPPDPPAGSMVYTFSGNVSLVQDGAGAAAIAGVQAGDPVTYTVIINLNEPGYVMTTLGILWRVDAGPWDFFFAQHQSGFLIDMVDSGYHTGINAVVALGFGANLNLPSGGTLAQPKGRVWLGDANHRVAIIKTDTTVTNWGIGTATPAVEEVMDEKGNVTKVFSNLTLTSIVPL